MSEQKIQGARRLGWRTLLGTLVAGLLVAACGGGGGDGSSATSAASFTEGTVSGFGSVIVNGVRFDDSAADVSDDDGTAMASGSVKLGMSVEIDSDRLDDVLARAIARHIRVGAALIGPVASVDTTAGTFVTLGQTVEVRSTTVLGGTLTGVADLAGKIVEVHGVFDATSGHYIATRIEDRQAVVLYKIRGLVSNLDTTAKTFNIGTALISYANVQPALLTSALANGLRVRVRLETAQTNGAWVAKSVLSAVTKLQNLPDAWVRGTVTAFTSTSAFEVNGIPVDASSATFDNGTTGLVLGARVQVRGSAVDGKIVATRVKVLHDNDDEIRGIELHGQVSEVDTSANTFTLRGLKVKYGVVIWVGGDETRLANGAGVEVKGVLSADRTTVTAVSIKFE